MADREVLSFAIADERAVLTINRRDFMGLEWSHAVILRDLTS